MFVFSSGGKKVVKERKNLVNIPKEFIIVQKCDMCVMDNEQIDAYRLFPILYQVDVVFEDGTEGEAIGCWYTGEDREVYLEKDNLPKGFKLVNYEFEKYVNNLVNELPLPFYDYLDNIFDEKENQHNVIFKNNMNRWEAINGKPVRTQILNFGLPSEEEEEIEEEIEETEEEEKEDEEND